jgi:hypothetical protein
MDCLPYELLRAIAAHYARAHGPTELMANFGVSRALRAVARDFFSSDRRAWLVTASHDDLVACARLGAVRLDARGIWPESAAHIPRTVRELCVRRLDCAARVPTPLTSLTVGANGAGMLTLEPLIVHNLLGLRTLSLWSCPSLLDVEPLARLTALTDLSLGECWAMHSIGALRCLTNLVSLDVRFARIERTPELGTRLTRLTLYGCRHLECIASLARLENLVDIDVSMCSRITDATPLSALAKLTRIRIMFCSPAVRAWGIARELLAQQPVVLE